MIAVEFLRLFRRHHPDWGREIARSITSKVTHNDGRHPQAQAFLGHFVLHNGRRRCAIWKSKTDIHRRDNMQLRWA